MFAGSGGWSAGKYDSRLMSCCPGGAAALRFVFLGDKFPGPGPGSLSLGLMNLISDRRREDAPCSGSDTPADPLGVSWFDDVSCAVLGIFKRSWSWSVMRTMGAGTGVGTAASLSVLPGKRDQQTY